MKSVLVADVLGCNLGVVNDGDGAQPRQHQGL